MQNNLLHKKRILITGITGFIGTHLAKKLEDLGADVYGISRSIHTPKILKANITNYSLINAFIKETKIDICFHLAGESLVEAGQSHPYRTFKVNTEGTLNILEISRKYKMEKIIIASTAHVYGENRLPYQENFTPKPTRPYETSKACTDLIAKSYADTFKLPVLIPRFVNIYGPGDLNFNRLVPGIFKAVLTNKSPQIWGGGAIREYLYIDDAVEAYIRLASVDISYLGESNIFNFGSRDRISVKSLVQKIIDASGKKLIMRKNLSKRPLEIKTQYVSSKKAKKILGWKSKVSLDQGLQKTLSWYTAYFKK